MLGSPRSHPERKGALRASSPACELARVWTHLATCALTRLRVNSLASVWTLPRVSSPRVDSLGHVCTH